MRTSNYSSEEGGCCNYTKRQIIYLAIEREIFSMKHDGMIYFPYQFIHSLLQAEKILSSCRSIEKVLCCIYKDVWYMLRWCIQAGFKKNVLFISFLLDAMVKTYDTKKIIFLIIIENYIKRRLHLKNNKALYI